MQILGIPESQSNVVDLDHVRRLVNFERDDELKAAYRLSAYHLDPGHFGKMKVDPALTLLSKNTAQALRSMMKNYPKHFPPEVETTAKFLEKFEDWHSACANKKYGPYCFSTSTPDINETIIKHIKEFVTVATTMTIPRKNKTKKSSKGQKKKTSVAERPSALGEELPSGSSKQPLDGTRVLKPPAKLPWQIHIRNASNTILQVVDDCMNNEGFSMFLTANLTSDCIESFHSVVRGYCNSPTPLIFKRALKLICLSQVFHTINKGTNVIGDPHEHLCLNTLANTLQSFKERHERKKEQNSSLPEHLQDTEVVKIIDSVWAKDEVSRRRTHNNEQVDDFFLFDPFDGPADDIASNHSDDDNSNAGDDNAPNDVDLDDEDPGGVIFDFEQQGEQENNMNNININGNFP